MAKKKGQSKKKTVKKLAKKTVKPTKKTKKKTSVKASGEFFEKNEATLEKNRAGGVMVFECMPPPLKHAVTIEIGQEYRKSPNRRIGDVLTPINKKIHPDTMFKCTPSEYEIINSKLEGGIEIVGQKHEIYMSKAESHRMDALANVEKLQKLAAEGRRKGYISSSSDEKLEQALMVDSDADMVRKINRAQNERELLKLQNKVRGQGKKYLVKMVQQRLEQLKGKAVAVA